VKHQPTAPLLQVEGVSFSPQIFASKSAGKSAGKAPAGNMGTYEILQRVSFAVNRGDRLALIGASGSGKTTLLRLLNRLNEPTQGTLYLEQQPFAKIPVRQLRQQIVLVLQESKLLGMTVQQALEYPLQLRQMPAVAIQQRLVACTERLQMPTEWLGRTEQQLSVGQRQWVAIARALITQPQILLLDEPTASLDLGRSHLLLSLLTELAQTQGLTVLMANHQLELAEVFCDRVLHLDRGQLLQDLPAHQMDWQRLKAQLMQTEAQQSAEWE
jgi:D-methionine transport system ATP-binding protein